MAAKPPLPSPRGLTKAFCLVLIKESPGPKLAPPHPPASRPLGSLFPGRSLLRLRRITTLPPPPVSLPLPLSLSPSPSPSLYPDLPF